MAILLFTSLKIGIMNSGVQVFDGSGEDRKCLHQSLSFDTLRLHAEKSDYLPDLEDSYSGRLNLIKPDTETRRLMFEIHDYLAEEKKVTGRRLISNHDAIDHGAGFWVSMIQIEREHDGMWSLWLEFTPF